MTNRLVCRWRRNRRAAHEGLSKTAIRDYHPILRKEDIVLASALLENPSALERHFQRVTASPTLSIMYDYPTLGTEEDENLVRFARWKYEGRRQFEKYNAMFKKLLNRVRRDIVSMHTDIINRNTEPGKCRPMVLTVQVSVHRLSRLLIATSFLIKKWLGLSDHYCLSSSHHQLIAV